MKTLEISLNSKNSTSGMIASSNIYKLIAHPKKEKVVWELLKLFWFSTHALIAVV